MPDCGGDCFQIEILHAPEDRARKRGDAGQVGIIGGECARVNGKSDAPILRSLRHEFGSLKFNRNGSGGVEVILRGKSGDDGDVVACVNLCCDGVCDFQSVDHICFLCL